MSRLAERSIVAFLIWIAVYPSVLLANYALHALGFTQLPLPVSVLLTTMITVPVLEFGAIPVIKKIVAKGEERLGVDGELRDD
ncbi:antibiotic biosynthesis monooxygenase (ABM) superfamily enzyme [Parvularcula dongshanensis]|uniref:Antibiotic biosynthesis monooxygenase (ABM) superfamily enzyme n=2 Tax=Parvularcula dongshanensis TaxID=1173995 RepID=A0A840I0Y2_9PROT|nr:antibiotic biosynthesis monooxygenase (ABM) superfamily enzyme [Parvularcula dongshanensis]